MMIGQQVIDSTYPDRMWVNAIGIELSCLHQKACFCFILCLASESQRQILSRSLSLSLPGSGRLKGPSTKAKVLVFLCLKYIHIPFSVKRGKMEKIAFYPTLPII